jgi:hypothetical protein
MSSTVSEIRDYPGEGIGIVVNHLPHDSYSRSVGPAARKALQSLGAALLRNGWDGKTQLHERWDYSEPDCPSTGASRTIVRFNIRAETREELGLGLGQVSETKDVVR